MIKRITNCPKSLNNRAIISLCSLLIYSCSDISQIGVPRKINVSGTQTAISLATQLISYVMENGPILPPAAGGMAGGMQQGGWNGGVSAPVQSYGGMQHQVMDCAKAFVGTDSQ